MKGMAPLKASGKDGYPALFFQRFWHIIRHEITQYCLAILNSDQGITDINGTDIVLIPKVPSPSSMSQLRPKSLCNILYKIIAKVLAIRL
ncbi:hypothetical protein V6N11_044599 [Hibiscus sabdariffa]|uniref:Reverse transcriptase n=2 Tax=Hibiscus sabdariffa TaxID=183260 RepID=A0ABR2NBT4_9ROSI